MLNSCGFSQNVRRGAGGGLEGNQTAWRRKPSTGCFWVGVLWQKSSEKPRTLAVVRGAIVKVLA